MVGEAFRLAAVAVTPQVRDDNGIAFCQFRGEEPPHQVCFRMPVDKQDGFFAAAAGQRVDHDARFRFDPLLVKFREILFVNRHSHPSPQPDPGIPEDRSAARARSEPPVPYPVS